jgi:heat shock protein HslJ
VTVDPWAGTSWRIVEVDGQPVAGDATIAFGDEGRVFGKSVVNRYFGTYVVDGDAVTVGPLGSTMMAGPPEAMAEEQLVLRALEGTLTVDGEVAGEEGAVTLRGSSTLCLLPAAADEPGPTV